MSQVYQNAKIFQFNSDSFGVASPITTFGGQLAITGDFSAPTSSIGTISTNTAIIGNSATLPKDVAYAGNGITLDANINQATREFKKVTIASSGARVLAGGATLHIDKMGGFVRLTIQPSASLAATTAAEATARLVFTGAIPLGYRPPVDTIVSLAMVVNSVWTAGCCATIASSDGSIYIDAAPTQGTTFTITQPMAMKTVLTTMYNSLI